MRLGPVVTGIVAVGAMIGVLAAFSSSASPYVTIAEARSASGDRLHVAGNIVPGSVHADVIRRTLVFRLKDAKGDEVMVRHVGEMPSNLSEAKTVVAVGGMKGSEFESNSLIVKCPSRYDAEQKKAGS